LKGKGREELSSPSSIVVSEPSVGTVDVLERWVNLAPVKDFCAIGDQIGGTVSRSSYQSGLADDLVSPCDCIGVFKFQFPSSDSKWCRSRESSCHRRTRGR
jgi:hypothetical protein